MCANVIVYCLLSVCPCSSETAQIQLSHRVRTEGPAATQPAQTGPQVVPTLPISKIPNFPAHAKSYGNCAAPSSKSYGNCLMETVCRPAIIAMLVVESSVRPQMAALSASVSPGGPPTHVRSLSTPTRPQPGCSRSKTCTLVVYTNMLQHTVPVDRPSQSA